MPYFSRLLRALALSLTCGVAAQVSAQTPASAPQSDGLVHVVSYYEVMPADHALAHGPRPAQIFSAYVESARQEPGALSFEVLHDIEKRNRYVVVEVWRDNSAFTQHRDSAASRQLAQSMQPWLLDSVDQRVNSEMR